MPRPPLEVLYEDNHCLAVYKPAGLLSAHFQGRTESLDRAAKDYLKARYAKPGNVFLGVVHRLDQPVSGVLLFARTSKAPARLSQQFREGTVEKVYWAVVDGSLEKTAGSLEDWLLKDAATNRVRIVEPHTPGSRLALLHFQRRAELGGLCLIELRPQTGRSHQLRVQMARAGCPIYGDAKYGSVHTFERTLALHARSLTFLHPTRNEPITIKADVPPLWLRRFAHLLAGARG